VANVCDGARHLLTEDTSKNYKKDPDLLKGLGLFEPLDNIKPLLVWLLGDDLAMKFGIKVKQLRAIAFPWQKASDEQVTKNLLKAVGDLTDLLVDETSPITNEEFKWRLNQKKVTGIKKLRLDVKTYRAKLDSGLLSTMPEMKDVDQKLDLAKHQVFKWGLVMFMYHKESRVKSEVGKDVHKGLKNLWQLYSTRASRSISARRGRRSSRPSWPWIRLRPRPRPLPSRVSQEAGSPPKARGRLRLWLRQKQPGPEPGGRNPPSSCSVSGFGPYGTAWSSQAGCSLQWQWQRLEGTHRPCENLKVDIGSRLACIQVLVHAYEG